MVRRCSRVAIRSTSGHVWATGGAAHLNDLYYVCKSEAHSRDDRAYKGTAFLCLLYPIAIFLRNKDVLTCSLNLLYMFKESTK